MKTSIADCRLNGATELRKCQLTQLYLLEVLADICDRHNLQYFLDAGTLLGAMRHQGFIPWDDDLDVGMPLKDYKKFLKIAKKELPESVLLQTPEKYPGVAVPYAKLRDRYSFYCEQSTTVELPCGIFIDIFPYAKFPKLPLPITRALVKWCYYSWTSERVYRTRCNGCVMGVFVSGIKAVAWNLIFRISKGIFNVLTLFSAHSIKYPPEVGYWKYPGFNEKDFFPLKKCAFEGRLFNIPNNPDPILTQMYGDWRTLPPESARKTHRSIICPTQAPDAPWALKYPKATQN